MYGNALRHRARVVVEVLLQGGSWWWCGGGRVHTDYIMASLQVELNPNEHIWDTHERKFHQRNPPIQIVAELEAALHQEWALVLPRNNSDGFLYT